MIKFWYEFFTANFEDEKVYNGYKFYKPGCWYKSNNGVEKAYMSFYDKNESLVSVRFSKDISSVDVWEGYDNFYELSYDALEWLNNLLYGEESNRT
jgi:hypothetical protein